MPVAAAITGAAVIGGAATVSAANSNKSAARHAADQNAQTIAATQTANNALEAPYVATGTKATGAIESFLGENGADSQSAAFDNWRNSTGYQFTKAQGLDAINSNLAVKGQLKSGAAVKAAVGYGTNLANQFGQQYLGNLQTQQGVGLQAAGANVNSNSSAAGAMVANNNNLAGAIGTANTGSANAFNAALGDAVSAYGLYQGQKTGSSYGGNAYGKPAFPANYQAYGGRG